VKREGIDTPNERNAAGRGAKEKQKTKWGSTQRQNNANCPNQNPGEKTVNKERDTVRGKKRTSKNQRLTGDARRDNKQKEEILEKS